MTLTAATRPATADGLLRPGNTNCGGCGMSLSLSLFGQALAAERQQCLLAIPACCAVVAAGAYPTSGYGVPVVATTFASAPAVASGLARVRDLNGERHHVVCWAGDGGTYDIGLATLSAAAERNEEIIYICYDNEIYGNTGGQRSSATPAGARTATTPAGKREGKKDMMAILAAHRVPYAATLSIAHPQDFARTFNPSTRLGAATGIVNMGGFTASLSTIFVIGVILDLLAGGAGYTLADFKVAFSFQYVVWAFGVVSLWRARRLTRAELAAQGTLIDPLPHAIARRWRRRH